MINYESISRQRRSFANNQREAASLNRKNQNLCENILFVFSIIFQNFIFFLLCKSSDGKIYIVGLSSLILICFYMTLVEEKRYVVRSKIAISVMGLLDIICFYVLLGTGSILSSFVYSTLLQSGLALQFFFSYIVKKKFQWNHYLGICFIFISCSTSIIFHSGIYNYALLSVGFLQFINSILKRIYLSKFILPDYELNRSTLLFGCLFGVIFLPFICVLFNKNFFKFVAAELRCLAGMDCLLMPIYLVMLVVSTFTHNYLLKNRRKIEGKNRIVRFGSFFSFLGYFCAEISIGDIDVPWDVIGCAGLAILGNIIYCIFEEQPNFISDDE